MSGRKLWTLLRVFHSKLLRLHSVGDRSGNVFGTSLEWYRQDEIGALGGKPLPIYTLSTTNPTWTCLGLNLCLYPVKTVTEQLNQGKVWKKNRMEEDRRPKRIQIGSYQEISKDEKRIERMNSSSNEQQRSGTRWWAKSAELTAADGRKVCGFTF